MKRLCIIALYAAACLFACFLEAAAQAERADSPSGHEVVSLEGRVVDADNRPVADASITARVMDNPSFEERKLGAWYKYETPKTTSRAEGTFQFDRLPMPYMLYARSPDGRQAGIVRVDSEARQATIAIGPVAKVRGSLLNRDQQPITNWKVMASINVNPDARAKKQFPLFYPFGGEATTNANGHYEIVGLVPGEEYKISFFNSQRGRGWNVATVNPTEPKTIELGEKRFDEALTIEEQTADYFRSRGPLADRLATIQRDAKSAGLRILLILGDPQAESSVRLVEFEDRNAPVFNDYLQLPVDSQDEAALAVLKESLGIDAAVLKLPATFALSTELEVLGSREELLKPEALTQFLRQHAPPRGDAKKLFAEALARAKAEDKRVFLYETGTFCYPCRLLARFIERNQDILEQQYVFVAIDDSRATHGKEIVENLRQGAEGGIPWWVIVDAQGKRLGTSNGPGGRNVGFPSEPAGINHFIKLLSDTGPRLNPTQLEMLRKDLLGPAK